MEQPCKNFKQVFSWEASVLHFYALSQLPPSSVSVGRGNSELLTVCAGKSFAFGLVRTFLNKATDGRIQYCKPDVAEYVCVTKCP